jgi:heat shock protein HslJ
MRTLPLVLILAVGLGACAVAVQRDPAGDPPLQLAGTRWHFIKAAGHDIPPAVRATLAFGSDGHVSGHAGCNGYGGPWTASNGALHFGGMISTKMACLQPAGAMQAEHDVFAALREAAAARMRDRQLILLDANGAAIATLEAQDGSQ